MAPEPVAAERVVFDELKVDPALGFGAVWLVPDFELDPDTPSVATPLWARAKPELPRMTAVDSRTNPMSCLWLMFDSSVAPTVVFLFM